MIICKTFLLAWFVMLGTYLMEFVKWKFPISGLRMEEKRTAIELLAVKERLVQANVALKWVDGEQELADGLTISWKHETLIKALPNPIWRIIYDPEFQSAPKKKIYQRNHDFVWLTNVPNISGEQDGFWSCVRSTGCSPPFTYLR